MSGIDMNLGEIYRAANDVREQVVAAPKNPYLAELAMLIANLAARMHDVETEITAIELLAEKRKEEDAGPKDCGFMFTGKYEKANQTASEIVESPPLYMGPLIESTGLTHVGGYREYEDPVSCDPVAHAREECACFKQNVTSEMSEAERDVTMKTHFVTVQYRATADLNDEIRDAIVKIHPITQDGILDYMRIVSDRDGA